MSRPEVLAGQPTDAEGAPVFGAPWQARAFALTVHLEAQGAFSWADWTSALGRACAEQAPGPDGYYTAWVEALGGLLAERGIASPEMVRATAEAWERAAETTPHGEPVTLDGNR